MSLYQKRNVYKKQEFSVQGIKVLPEIGYRNRIKDDMFKFTNFNAKRLMHKALCTVYFSGLIEKT